MIFFNRSATPRWVVFLYDILICTAAAFLAYLLRFNFDIPENELEEMKWGLPTIIAVRFISFRIFRVYSGLFRYTSINDAKRVFAVLFLGSCFLGFLNAARFYAMDGRFIVPLSVLVIDFLGSIFFLTSTRLGGKLLYSQLSQATKYVSDVLIFGAGESGVVAKRTLERDRGTKYRVIAFLDKDEQKIGNKIEGVRVINSASLENLLQKNSISHLIIAIQKISSEELNEIVEIALKYGVTVRHVPPINKWINRELSFNQIKHLKIEDLLGRDPIELSTKNITKELSKKTILVTGAAGSIGSEIVRQLLKYPIEKVLLLDHAESPLYEMELELNQSGYNGRFEVFIGDVRDKIRINEILSSSNVEILFHAAAYKHVPLMELNAYESIRTNIFGTLNVLEACVAHNVQEFVMISTDKAINPTNVMGATKRVAELLTQAYSEGKIKAVITRFGNVLGSNGSVIPIFRRQIENGGPITVTHPDVTRFFMTIPEACQLVLESSITGKAGEIYVFDMGKSVKVVDLAKKMIKLAGLQEGKDIHIQFIGLRPGEKLYEEVISQSENNIPTHHQKILKSEVRRVKKPELEELLSELKIALEEKDMLMAIKLIKSVVPEYRSKNSVYQSLDESES
ncbi:MAG: polysaccharide biosynthesis protein [Flavobacteriales bacterium]|nr:polysaccharide biosynthesis protein [Flavobacteriales bacterium]